MNATSHSPTPHHHQPANPGHRQPVDTRRRGGPTWLTLVAAAGCCLATPVATWWLVGDLTEPTPAGTDLDYTYRPVPMSPATELGIGLGAVLVALATGIVLVWTSRRRWFDPRWWATIAPLLFAGAVVGAGWRVVTAGSIGANIGAGLVLLFCFPMVILVLLWCLAWSAYLVISVRRTPGAGTEK